MAATQQPTMFLLFALITLSFIIISSNAADCIGTGAISVYWGHGVNITVEGTLQATCATGYYDIVIIVGLTVYNNGSTSLLNLENHCGSGKNPCSNLQTEIEYCQEKNIKVLLSISGDLTATGRYSNSASSSSENVTNQIADYLFKNYLSGAEKGPLGNVTLDGIDFMDLPKSSNIKWDELVKAISEFTTAKKIYLSATPQCVYPDYYLGDVIKTGLLDYVWVDFFYNPSCIYSNGDATNLLKALKTWTSGVPKSSIFLGLTATKEIAGYISPDALKSEVLPSSKEASNYGGVMIWNRYYDAINNYTAQIKDSVPKVCRCVCDETASTSFYGLRPGSLPLMGSM